MAELFSELKASGVAAVNIDHVRRIIERVGNPEEMDGGAAAASAHAAPPEPPQGTADADGLWERTGRWLSARRYYRDPQDCMIGGVASGLSKYFGASDPLPWRIILVLLAVMSFSVVAVLYLVVWAVTPAARTPEERLRMQGRAVNPTTLNEAIMTPPPAPGRARNADNAARSFFGTLLVALLFCAKLLLLGFLTALLLGLLVLGGCLACATFAAPEQLVDWWDFSPDAALVFQTSRYLLWIAWGGVVSGLVAAGILFFAVVRWLIVRPDDKPLGRGTTVSLTVVCLISATMAVTLAAVWAVRMDRETDLQWRKANTIDGVFITPDDRQRFALAGWNATGLKNCDDHDSYTSRTYDFGGEDGLVYFRFEKRNRLRPMTGQLERRENLPAGRYRLEAVCYAKGQGAFLYAKRPAGAGGAELLRTGISSQTVNGTGNMAYMTAADARHTRLFGDTLTDAWWAAEGREEAEGWSYVRTPDFVHPGGELAYGLRFDMRAGADEVGLVEVYVVSASQPDSTAVAAQVARP